MLRDHMVGDELHVALRGNHFRRRGAHRLYIIIRHHGATSSLLDKRYVGDWLLAYHGHSGAQVVINLAALIVLYQALSQHDPDLRVMLPIPILTCAKGAQVADRRSIEVIGFSRSDCYQGDAATLESAAQPVETVLP